VKTLTFYLDFISPYAYLAFERLPVALQGLSYAVDYKPVLFAGLLKHHGQLGPAEIAGKREWTYRQVLWQAHHHGVPMQMPAAHPFNPLALLRLALACGDGTGRANRHVCETVFRHVWRGGADAADATRLRALHTALQRPMTPRRRRSSSPRRSAPSSSGTTSISTVRWPPSLPSSSSAGWMRGSAFIFALLAFAAGFIVRPFGAIFFGRLGDMIGRKYTFLVTILIMGLSTFIVGMLPTYASIGVAAPIILIALRLLQGLALGGEYGGAATYVAEHAPHGKRGAYTSWIQTTATLGLFLSLMVILGTRTAHRRGGVRRLGLAHSVPRVDPAAGHLGVDPPALNESPAFQKMKAEGKTSKAPLTDPSASGRT
jgi:hypothetical protein